MKSKYWLKLYHEILDDPKMCLLSDRLYRRTIETFLLAGDFDKDGELPELEYMAWRLRLTPEELETDLIELSKVDIVINQDEKWLVVKFEDRQKPVSDVERKQRQRERDKKASYYGHEDVTNRDGELDIELTEEPEKPANAGTSTPVSLDEWLKSLRNGKNKQAILLRMTKTLYPDLVEYPDYGYIGSVAKKVRGAGRLATLLWECVPRRPTGDILAYVQAYSKGEAAEADIDKELKEKGYEQR